MKEVHSCTIINKTKGKLPRLPFVYIKEEILGTKYDLSIGFVSAREQKSINKKYRNIDKTTNILSFPLSKNSGEITFDLVKSKKDAPLFNMPTATFLKYLFIHGCLHLKGYDHSDIMEEEEIKFLNRFS